MVGKLPTGRWAALECLLSNRHLLSYSQDYRALIARVCFDNRDFLGRCGNLECKDKPYFIKPRRNSKFCKGCRRYDALQRVKKSQAKKRQSARKGKGRA